jgi:hypothetical protein
MNRTEEHVGNFKAAFFHDKGGIFAGSKHIVFSIDNKGQEEKTGQKMLEEIAEGPRLQMLGLCVVDIEANDSDVRAAVEAAGHRLEALLTCGGRKLEK